MGDAGDDILVAGTTDFDAVDAAVCAIMDEWTSGANYNTRVGHLRGDLSGGLNGSTFLKKTTVHDDGVEDTLTGSAGQDWFLLNLDGDHGAVKDKVTDLGAQEFADDIDFILGP